MHDTHTQMCKGQNESNSKYNLGRKKHSQCKLGEILIVFLQIYLDISTYWELPTQYLDVLAVQSFVSCKTLTCSSVPAFRYLKLRRISSAHPCCWCHGFTVRSHSVAASAAYFVINSIIRLSLLPHKEIKEVISWHKSVMQLWNIL